MVFSEDWFSTPLVTITCQDDGEFEQPNWEDLSCVIRRFHKMNFLWWLFNITATTTECYECTTTSKYTLDDLQKTFHFDVDLCPVIKYTHHNNPSNLVYVLLILAPTWPGVSGPWPLLGYLCTRGNVRADTGTSSGLSSLCVHAC